MTQEPTKTYLKLATFMIGMTRFTSSYKRIYLSAGNLKTIWSEIPISIKSVSINEVGVSFGDYKMVVE